MNKTTPYEDLIAAKLDQIAVPDMSDSIWANIEMQLDELPDAPEEKSSGGETGNAWYGIITLIVVVTLCWWFYHNKQPKPGNEIVPPVQVIIPPKDSPVSIERITRKPVPVIIKKDTINAVISNDPIPEEEKVEEKISPLIADSPAVRQQIIDTVAVYPPQKKRKGVRGINSNDYRLSVERDSIKP